MADLDSNPVPHRDPHAGVVVLGARGAVGRALVERLDADGESAIAVTRGALPVWAAAASRCRWRRADLYADSGALADLPPPLTVLSAGPLDGLAAWLERDRPPVARVVALSSTSLHVKGGSIDATERDIAARLADAERRLAGWCTANGAAWTVLRPTLIVSARDGDGLDWIARAARRFGRVALPRASLGLRQPIDAREVARALALARAAHATHGRAYDLPGGETLSYRELVARVLAMRAPGTRCRVLPDALFRAGAAIARRHRALAALTPAVIARMDQNLIFDPGPYERDCGFRAEAARYGE